MYICFAFDKDKAYTKEIQSGLPENDESSFRFQLTV